jgi:hypothetical protein
MRALVIEVLALRELIEVLICKIVVAIAMNPECACVFTSFCAFLCTALDHVDIIDCPELEANWAIVLLLPLLLALIAKSIVPCPSLGLVESCRLRATSFAKRALLTFPSHSKLISDLWSDRSLHCVKAIEVIS